MQSLSILVECSSSAYKHLRLHRSSEILRMECGSHDIPRCGPRSAWEKTHSMAEWLHDIIFLNKHTFGPADTGQIKSPGSAATLQATLQATLHFCQSDINRESYAGDCSSEIPRQICSHLLEAKMQWETRPIARGQFLT